MAFDREKTLQSAQRLVGRRKYGRAIAEYQRVMEHDPNDARTLLRIGDLQARLGNYAEAIATYDRVALFYSGRGFSLKAIAVLKQIRELIDRHVPHVAEQYSHVSPKLAQLYAELGLLSDALATYDAVARTLQSRGRDRDAVEIIRRMIDLEEANPLPHLRLAEALCRIQRVGQAIEHFWSAAQLLRGQDRQEDALKVLERILHFRQDAAASRVAAEIYLARGTREAGLQALSRLQSCFEADPRDMETLGLLARAFDQIEQPDKSVEVYKEMVRVGLESGSGPALEEHLEHLVRVAGGDPEVQQLVAQARFDTQTSQLEGRGWAEAVDRAAADRAAADREVVHSEAPSSLGDEDIEFLEEDSFADLPLSELEAASRPPSEVSKEPLARLHREVSRRPPLGPKLGGDASYVDKALADAEVFRGLKLYAKAGAVLREALGRDPASLELHDALRQVLLEVGDTAAAAAEMIELATLYVEDKRFGDARQELVEHQRIIPHSPEASRLLRHIGLLEARKRVAGQRASQPAEAGPRGRAADPPAAAHPVGPTPARPLPSFQLEEESGAALASVGLGAYGAAATVDSEAPDSVISVSPESDGSVVYVQSEPPHGDSPLAPPLPSMGQLDKPAAGFRAPELGSPSGVSLSPGSLSPISLPPGSLPPISLGPMVDEAPAPVSLPAGFSPGAGSLPSSAPAPGDLALPREPLMPLQPATTNWAEHSSGSNRRAHPSAQPAAFRSSPTRGAIPVPRAFAKHARQPAGTRPNFNSPQLPSAPAGTEEGRVARPVGLGAGGAPTRLAYRSKPTLPSTPAAARVDGASVVPSAALTVRGSRPVAPDGVASEEPRPPEPFSAGLPTAATPATREGDGPEEATLPAALGLKGPSSPPPSWGEVTLQISGGGVDVQPGGPAPAGGPPIAPAANLGIVSSERAAPHSGADPAAAALEEAAFFAARGLPEDALTILRDELQRRAGEPRLLAAVAELEAAKPETPLEPSSPNNASGAELVGVKFSTDGMLDQQHTNIDTALDLEATVTEPSDAEVDVDAVFSKFKEGVKAQIPESDSTTHYDLAVAYKEMGLVEDALAQFRIAARDPKRACSCLGMIALLHREAGRLDDAAEALVQGLSLPQKSVSQEFGLYYGLGEIYELKADADEAIYYFGRIQRRDPNYRGVSERIERLRPQARRRSDPVRFAGSFDEAFDQLQKDS